MIVLITGAGHTGKTLLAQRMLEKYRWPCLSIDHLKMGLIRSGYTDLTPADDDALTAYLWPVVRETVKTAIENKQNLIVEGCYVPADWRRDFDERYLSSIRFICLAMTDDYIDAHFADIKAHASDVEARQDDTDCTPERLKADNRAYIEAFRDDAVLIDGDYGQTLRAILDGPEGPGVQIGHIAMYVNDLEAARDFFTRYLGGESGAGYHNRATGFRSCFLRFEGGARLELMNRPQMADGEKHPNRTGYAHIAFSLGSREAVDALTERLCADGYELVSGPRVTGDGYYESCIVSIEGNQIELTV